MSTSSLKKLADNIFWTVDRFLMKYPILNHIRFAWNRFYSVEFTKVSGKRVKYVRTLKYIVLAGALMIAIIIASGISIGMICIGLSVATLQRVLGVSVFIIYLLLAIVISTVLAILLGPVFMGIFSFFVREELNDYVEPTHVFVFYSDPFYRQYIITAMILYAIVSALHLIAGFIGTIANPLRFIPLLSNIISYSLLTLVTWICSYPIFEFLFRIEASRLKAMKESEGGEKQPVQPQQKPWYDVTVVSEEREGEKELRGVLLTLDSEETPAEPSTEDMDVKFDLKFFIEKAGFQYPTDIGDILKTSLEKLRADLNNQNWLKGIISSGIIYLGFLFLIPSLVTFPIGMLSLTRLFHRR